MTNWVKVVEYCCLTFLTLLTNTLSAENDVRKIDIEQSIVWGPGLKAEFFVPVRYFFIQAVSEDGSNFTESAGERPFEVTFEHSREDRIRCAVQIFDKHDGVYIVRYRPYATYDGLIINVRHDNKHIAHSPYELKGLVRHEKCYCPEADIEKWYEHMGCPASYVQIERDLAPFSDVDLEVTANETVARYNRRGSHSLCQYKILDNTLYRKCQGQHVGFKMFSDQILLSLTRKVHLPDVEIFVNLGDWPLETGIFAPNLLPIFSWCGSDDSHDIVMPTYDLTEASLEMMSRVSLDMISVLGKGGPAWANKTDKAFWRGRDSRQERLDLVVLSRKHPDIIDAAMTHMFFFPKDTDKYGELVQSISFFDFFKHKYQITLDGTVAAYRLPYLLGGDAVVLKQDSPYYEHFYKDLVPYKHYIPIQRNVADLLEQIQWAKDNDDKVQQIVKNARTFALNNLLPSDIFCYHIKLFHEYSKRQKSRPLPPGDGWDLVEQPSGWDAKCTCDTTKSSQEKHDEL